jgi:large subunit ribosomal protein L30
MAKKVSVKLVKSSIGRLPKQRATIKALGLNKLNSMVEHELNPAVQGMIDKVSHLVEVKELG